MSIQIPYKLKVIKPKLYSEVILQLEKDIGLVGIKVNWKTQSTPEDFWREFLNEIEQLLTNEPEKFRSLMYRVDVPESKLVELYKIGGREMVMEISKLILHREIEKVAMRLGGTYS